MHGAPRLDSAAAELAAGNWEAARAGFQSDLRRQESPEAFFGLASALWWLGETDGAVRAHEQAYAGFRRGGSPDGAALAALSLCLIYGASLGNLAAAQGWAGRLARLVEEGDLAPMRGWLALCRAGHANETADPAAAEVHAREALEAARAAGDTDLELCALSEIGFTLIRQGRIGDGTALLDEAMAGALAGEGKRLDTVVFTGCRSIISCSRSLEFERAIQWIHASDAFSRRYGNPHLYTTCRTHYGCLLFCQGKWEEAEQELRTALRIGKAAEPWLYAEALAKLAELRVAQGRLAEAGELLAGFGDHPAAAYPLAQIHLRRGEPEVAASLLRRRLAGASQDSIEVAPLCELASDAEIAIGDLPSATERASRLAKVGERAGCQAMLARGCRALGRVHLASGDFEVAVGRFARALDVFTRLGMPLDAARAHLLLARAFCERERATAIAEARAALATFDGLGAAGDADEASAFLRELGVRAVRRGPRPAAKLTKREREVLALLSEGLSNREIAERLFLTRKTVEHHVRSVLAKLNVSNRTEAAAYVVRHLANDR